MAEVASPQANLVAEILAKHWRISEPAVRTHLGVSRATWRVGSLYWLSQAEEIRSSALLSQAELLLGLERSLRNESVSFSIPEIVASESGSLLVIDDNYVWCLTRHLSGFHPDAADPNMYPKLAEGLAGFHHALRKIGESQSLQIPGGISIKTRQNISRFTPETFVAFTSNPREKEVLQRTAAWLLPRLDRFERLPRQIVHGDWTPHNVLFDRTGQSACLTAVLDFEAVSSDPVCVDVANICSTLFMWSGLDKLEERFAKVVEIYQMAAGVPVEWEDIHTAMLAHWFCHYWSWRDRLQYGEFGQEVKNRLCLRVSTVLSYVSNSADWSR